ncbi:hypothetical protein KRR40_17425 [Niabella defluvii]|nr:hypothetical protein KRR40_17425 [Niabella sp. I65]
MSSKENKEWEKKEDGEKVLIQAKGISYEFQKNGRGLTSFNPSSLGWLFGKHLN